jgi:ABC-type transporter Mla subunit MlaD
MEVTQDQWDGLIQGLTAMSKRQEAMQNSQQNIESKLDQIKTTLESTNSLIDKNGDFLGDKLDDIVEAVKGNH